LTAPEVHVGRGQIVLKRWGAVPVNRAVHPAVPAGDSLAAAFHHFSAVVAEPVLLTSKALDNASMAVFDAGAKSFSVGAARSAVMTALLGERNGWDG
jgi:hypothetical protein